MLLKAEFFDIFLHVFLIAKPSEKIFQTAPL